MDHGKSCRSTADFGFLRIIFSTVSMESHDQKSPEENQRPKTCSWNDFHVSFLFQKLVCKVDQLVKRRAKSGLIKVKVDWDGAKEFVAQHLDKEIKVLNLRARKTEFLST